MIIYNHRENTIPDRKYERMVHIKGKIMTWDEFRVRCKMDALCRYYSGYSSAELTAEDIINDYDESFFLR